MPDFGHLIAGRHRPEGDRHAGLERAVHNADGGDRAQILVVVRVEDQRPERGVGGAGWRRDAVDHRFQNGLDPRPLLRRHLEHLLGIDAHEVCDFVTAAFGLRPRQVDLVEDGDDFEVGLEGQEEVGERLGLHALGGVHHQDRAFARGEGAGDLVGEVDVAGGVDQVEVEVAAIPRSVRHANGVQLDGDSPLPLQFIGVQHLIPHLTAVQGGGGFQEPVGQRGLAVIDVGDDAEVANEVGPHGESGVVGSGGAVGGFAFATRRGMKPVPRR